MYPPAASIPYRPVPAVVSSTPSSNDSCGSRYSALTWCTAYSAKPPSAVIPLARCPLSRFP